MVADLKKNVTIFITKVLPRLYEVKEKSGIREMLNFTLPVCGENSPNSTGINECMIRFIYKGQLLPEEGIP